MSCLINKSCVIQHHMRKQFLPLILASREKTTYYSKRKGVSIDWMAKIQQPLDLSFDGFRKWYNRRKWEDVKQDQQFVPERQAALGWDLSAAHFVVARGGAVKFEGYDRWVEKNIDGKFHLPKSQVNSMCVEAIDCSNLNIMYGSFENFRHLAGLKYLKLSGCEHVDDYCMDRMVMFRDSLVHLDLSGCPNVSERGLSTLHKLRKLQILEIQDMAMVPQPALIGLMIEESLPHCKVIDIDYTNTNVVNTDTNSADTPSFVKNVDQFFDAVKREQQPEYYLDNLIARRNPKQKNVT